LRGGAARCALLADAALCYGHATALVAQGAPSAAKATGGKAGDAAPRGSSSWADIVKLGPGAVVQGKARAPTPRCAAPRALAQPSLPRR
jgi:hypothetical protein